MQTYIAHQAASYLSKRLQTTVIVSSVDIDFFDKFNLNGVFIADEKNDTLLYTSKLGIKTNSWFFLQNNPTIEEVIISDATINLHRDNNSAYWNYDFILNSFQSNSKEDKATNGSIPKLDLEKITLDKIKFNYIDKWIGTDYIAHIGHFDIAIDAISWKDKLVQIESIVGNAVTIGINEYTGGRPAHLKKPRKPYSFSPFNPELWQFAIQSLIINGSRFYLEYPEKPVYANKFDERHLDIKGIDLLAKDISIVGDTIIGSIKDLTARDRSGLAINAMQALVKVSPNIAECKQLYLKTDHSELRHYYAMRYDKFPDFLNYIEKVEMEGNLSGATIGFNDILFFTDELQTLKDKTVLFTGKGKGTVDKLNGTGIEIFDGISRWKGDVSLLGIPNMDAFFIESKAFTATTSGKGMRHYFPSLANQTTFNANRLQYANIDGAFSGYINHFNTSLKIASNLGGVQLDGKVKNVLSDEIVYDFNAITNSLQLNEILNTDLLGTLNANTTVKGVLKNGENKGLAVKGNVDAIKIGNYLYSDIFVDGVFNEKNFEGTISSKDENFIGKLDGVMDYDKINPHYKVDANIQHVNLYQLGLTSNKIHGSGELNVDFKGKKIDDFIGTALLYNLQLFDDTNKLNIDQLYLNANKNIEQNKTLNIATNGLQARMTGQFDIAGLPHSLKAFLNKYIPNYVNTDASIPKQQQFNFDITAGNLHPLVRIFDLPFQVDSGMNISGYFDNTKQLLNLEGFIKGLSLYDIIANDISLAANTTDKGFYTNIKLNKFRFDNYEIASSLNLKSNVFQDQGVFTLSTSSDNTLGDALISGNAQAINDSIHLKINQSNFYFNHKKWSISDGNEVIFANNNVLIKQLLMASGNQQIAINKEYANWNQANIDVNQIELSPINNMIGFDDINIQGVLNGNFVIDKLLDSMLIDYDITAPATTIDDIKFGTIKSNGAVDVHKGLWVLNEGSSIQYENAVGAIEGAWNFKDEEIDLDINAEKLPLVWIQPFAKGYINNLSGTSSFYVQIAGDRLNPNVIGDIYLKNAAVTPDITGVNYKIPDGQIKVDNMYFTLLPFRVFDEQENHGLLSGSILHDGLSKLDFSLNFSSDQIMALNLNKFQGDYFYGTIFAKANVSLRGLVDNVHMNIIGTPLKSSKLFIPIKSESDYSMYNYIQFKKHDDSNSVPIKPRKEYNYNLRIDAIATKDLEAIIILDEETNDQLQTKGYGNLTLEIPSDGDMRLNGVYVIDEGTYNFAFKQLEILNYKKQFIIDPQSSIKWNGDLYDADLDISAYTQVKARLYDLILNETDRIALTKSELSDAQLTQLFNVKMNMIGRLSQPNLKFNINTVENRSIGTYAYQKLQRINADERELLNQVTGLLLLGQFIPPEGFNASASNASISAGAITNMSEMFSTVASSQISNFANKLLGIEDLYIGLRYKNYAMSGIDPLNPTGYTNRNEAGFNVRKNFLNNRLIAEVGGVYDWGVQKASGSLSDNIAGDFRIQYSLSADGSVRMKLFRTSSYDAVLQQNIGRHGAGIIYKKSFTSFSDLFKRRKFYLLNLNDSSAINKN